jgi:hypothetical protein
MTELLEKAIANLSKLPEEQQDLFANWILEKLAMADDDVDAEWETAVLTQALGKALQPDNSIDYETLRAKGVEISLYDLFPEHANDD